MSLRLSIGALANFPDHVFGFVIPCIFAPRTHGINENVLVAQAAMIVARDGSSISEEYVHGADNMSASHWVDFVHAIHGPSERIQVRDILRAFSSAYSYFAILPQVVA